MRQPLFTGLTHVLLPLLALTAVPYATAADEADKVKNTLQRVSQLKTADKQLIQEKPSQPKVIKAPAEQPATPATPQKAVAADAVEKTENPTPKPAPKPITKNVPKLPAVQKEAPEKTPARRPAPTAAPKQLTPPVKPVVKPAAEKTPARPAPEKTPARQQPTTAAKPADMQKQPIRPISKPTAKTPRLPAPDQNATTKVPRRPAETNEGKKVPQRAAETDASKDRQPTRPQAPIRELQPTTPPVAGGAGAQPVPSPAPSGSSDSPSSASGTPDQAGRHAQGNRDSAVPSNRQPSQRPGQARRPTPAATHNVNRERRHQSNGNHRPGRKHRPSYVTPELESALPLAALALTVIATAAIVGNTANPEPVWSGPVPNDPLQPLPNVSGVVPVATQVVACPSPAEMRRVEQEYINSSTTALDAELNTAMLAFIFACDPQPEQLSCPGRADMQTVEQRYWQTSAMSAELDMATQAFILACHPQPSQVRCPSQLQLLDMERDLSLAPDTMDPVLRTATSAFILACRPQPTILPPINTMISAGKQRVQSPALTAIASNPALASGTVRCPTGADLAALEEDYAWASERGELYPALETAIRALVLACNPAPASTRCPPAAQLQALESDLSQTSADTMPIADRIANTALALTCR